MFAPSNDPRMYERMNNPGPVSQMDQGRGIPSQSSSMWPGQMGAGANQSSQGMYRGPQNPYSWGGRASQNRMNFGPSNRFQQRPQPNQNQYSNPTPGQNPMMGGINPIMNSRMPNFGSPNIGMPNFNFGPSFNPNMPLPNKPPMIGRPTPDAQGYYGGYRDAEGVNHPGNQLGMSYIL